MIQRLFPVTVCASRFDRPHTPNCGCELWEEVLMESLLKSKVGLQEKRIGAVSELWLPKILRITHGWDPPVHNLEFGGANEYNAKGRHT